MIQENGTSPNPHIVDSPQPGPAARRREEARLREAGPTPFTEAGLQERQTLWGMEKEGTREGGI